jgi:uncharacterized protein (TIGR03437 family)
MKRSHISCLAVASILAGVAIQTPLRGQTGGAIEPVTLTNSFGPSDDGSAGPIPLGIDGATGINFFGQNFTQVYVNNNGNLTFSSAFGTYTPNGLATGVGQPIIAPFFADVDTRGSGSGLVMYGNATVHGFNAFVANYINVGYYGAHTDKLDSFQAVLIDRSDTGAGNFDIEFNYSNILWETGDASGGRSGLGGVSAAAGYSNGLSGTSNVYYQFPGSLVNGALINGGPNALISNSQNSTVPGRYVFQVRNGTVMTGPPTPPPPAPLMVSGMTDLGTIPLGSSIGGTLSISGGTPPYTITPSGTLPPGIFLSGGGVSGVPTQPGNYSVGALIRDSEGVGASISFSFSVFGFITTALPPGITGSPYSASVGVAGGNPPYSFSISGLPRGLTGSSSGYINGIVGSPSTISVTVTATEGSGVSISGTLTLTFSAPPPLTVPTTTLPAGTVSTVYSQALSAMGGAPPYTWSMSSGTLPQGMSLRSGGTVAGIPSQFGTFSFAARATDFTGASAVGAFSLTIMPPALTITPSGGALASGMAKVDYPGQLIAASGGTGPYTLTVSAGSLPPGLALDAFGTISGTPTSPGLYSFTVTAMDTAGGSASAPLSIMVRSFSTDLLLSTSSLTFNLMAGSTLLPNPQEVGVQSTVVATPIGYSVSVSPATATWLTVTPSAGTTPATLTVSVNSQATSLASSTTPYQATLTVACTSSACTGNSQQIGVSLSVSNPPPMLTISSSLVSFTVSAAAPQTVSQSLTLQNTGGGSIGISSITCAAAWCGFSGTPGTIGPGAVASLNITANPAGLSAGYYRTTLTIKCSVGVYVVPVTLFIAGASQMTLSPSGAQFQVSPGGTPAGPPTSLLVSVSSATPVAFTASLSPNVPWLTLVNAAGMASAGQPGTVTYSFNTGVITNLTPQTYYAMIQVSIPGLVNSPQTYEVVLNLVPATAPQQPRPNPAGLLFITGASSTPPPQTITLAPSSSAPVSYALSTGTMSGGNWLQASPALGTATPGTPAVTQVSVNPAGLQPGVFYGGVNYAFGSAGVRTVNVTLIVTGAVAAHQVSEAATPRAGCTPSQLVPAQTGLLGNFSAPVAWPTPLTIQLVDDCGNFVSTGQVVATFSNGDPPLPLALTNPTSGLYAGTWTPRNSSPQVSINARVSAPGLPSVIAQIAGTVTPNAAPVLFSNSTLNLYNPQVGAALAPGTLVQISGSGLAAASAVAPAGAALPTTLSGVQVILGGTAAPLQSVSPKTLTAEVPFELTAGMQYQVLVSANGALTTPDQVQLANTSPGVSTGMAGLLAASHANGNAVTEAAPAAPGETVYLIAAGLGATDSQVGDGALSPSMPLANALDMPSITLNNEPVAITFAGLQPGMVGIYQVNFTVPSDAANGDLTLVLSQDGVPANSAVLPVKAAH